MTNDEIDAKARELSAVIRNEPIETASRIARNAVCYLLREAYEEAAMKAADYHASIRDRENPKFEGVDTPAKRRGGMTASNDICHTILALKDSLVQEPVVLHLDTYCYPPRGMEYDVDNKNPIL
jgi:hypothetical protein